MSDKQLNTDHEFQFLLTASQLTPPAVCDLIIFEQADVNVSSFSISPCSVVGASRGEYTG